MNHSPSVPTERSPRRIRRAATPLFALGSILSAGNVIAGDDYRHVIRPGDTLIGIAREMMEDSRDWLRVQRLNGIADPHRLMPGMSLRIPVPLLRREPVQARLASITGDVRSGGAPLAAGASIGSGAELMTGTQSFAVVELIDGTHLVLQPDSRLRVEELSRYRNTTRPQTRLRLESGRVESIVTKGSTPQPQYRIETPTVAIGVRGTRFRVGTDDASTSSRTEVTDGKVDVKGRSAGAKAIRVAAGYGVVAGTDGKVSTPVTLLSSPDLGGLPKLHERTIVRLAFPPLVGAQRYRLQVGVGSDMGKILAEAVGDQPEAKFAGLADGDYVLRVRGIDARGLEGKDGDFAFTLKARPEPPFAVSPVGGTKLRAESVELAWATNPEAVGYRVQLATDGGFAAPIADIDGIENTTLVPTVKLMPGDYFWRARSIRANGDAGPWGDAQRFVLGPPPMAPEPPAIGKDQLTVAWAGEPGQSFLFQLARDPTFADLVVEQDLQQPTTTLARPKAGLYFMRVRATDADGFVGPFTSPQTVVVPNPPPPWWLPLLMLVPLVL